MRHPKEIGDRTTLAVMYAFQLQGTPMFLPFGENTRCDLIVEMGRKLRRIQCKTGRLRKGAVLFAVCSTYGHHPNPKILKRDYQGEVDDFAVYCPDLGTVYLVPIDDLPIRTTAALRVHRPKNNQYKCVRLAAQYEIARFEVY
jgi:hypothetical protein